MTDILSDASNDVSLTDGANVTLGLSPYCSYENAKLYFAGRLGTTAWDSATKADQDKALLQATRIIDRLTFVGSKTYSDQKRQFPRGGDTDIPTNIEFATCEIALRLLDGVEIESEIESMQVSTHRIGPVSASLDQNSKPIHILCGIPSYEAWLYLRPYVRIQESIILARVN